MSSQKTQLETSSICGEGEEEEDKLARAMRSFACPGCFVCTKPDALVADGSQDNAPLTYDVFLMEFQVRDWVSNWPEDGRPRRVRDLNGVGGLRNRQFMVGRDEFLKYPNLGFVHLCNRLFLAGVPSIFHAPFARLIYSRASMFAYDAANVGRRVIPVVVTVDVFLVHEEDEEDEEDENIIAEVVRSSLDDEMDWMVPATKASIEALEKVEIKDVDDKCMICLEELSMGISEVRKMPCSHLYHGDCIVQWLESSHICPLCRFEMPTGLS